MEQPTEGSSYIKLNISVAYCELQVQATITTTSEFHDVEELMTSPTYPQTTSGALSRETKEECKEKPKIR